MFDYIYLILIINFFVKLQYSNFDYLLGPWEIVGSGLLFGYIGHNLDGFNNYMLKRINQGREELGLPPILSKLEYEPKNTSFWK